MCTPEILFPKQQLTREELIEVIQELRPTHERPAFVAISGFGGSGKSTLATAICDTIPGAKAISIDDFIVGSRTQRSSDWQTFDRSRLKREVLDTARVGEVLRYQQYNSGEWVSGRGGSWREVTIGSVVVIEGCGVIHPDLMPSYSYSGWINLSHEAALASAKKRDIGETILFGDDDTSRLWDEVWGPNDKDFFNTFRPDQLATTLVEPQF